MNTLHDRLSEIEARADAATEGPWEAEETQARTAGVWAHGVEGMMIASPTIEADAEFIASARSDVPTLVAALRAILGLHRPVDIEPSATVCSECSYQLPNGLYLGKIEEYPCATVRAAASALGAAAS